MQKRNMSVNFYGAKIFFGCNKVSIYSSMSNMSINSVLDIFIVQKHLVEFCSFFQDFSSCYFIIMHLEDIMYTNVLIYPPCL